MSYICRDCHERIHKLGLPLLELVEVACKYHVVGKQLYFIPSSTEGRKINQLLSLLETKRYLISTEIGLDEICFKPNFTTSFFIDYSEHFCWCHMERNYLDN